MKCIYKKCKYCHPHQFYESYSVCSLTGRTFKNNMTAYCSIDSEIKEAEKMLDRLKSARELIASVNEHGMGV